MIRFFATALLIIFGLSVSAELSAQTSEARLASATITIPFNPPLDRSLAFRQGRTTIENGKSQSDELVFDLSFEKIPDGYRMMAVYRLPPELEPVAHLPEVKRLYNKFVFLLDGNANVIGFENEDEYWARTERAMISSSSDQNNKFVAASIREMRKRPDEIRFDTIGANILPIIGLAGSRHIPGLKNSQDVATVSNIGGAPINGTIEARLVTVDGQTAIYEEKGTVAKADVKAAVVDSVKSAAGIYGKDVVRMSVKGVEKTNFSDLTTDITYRVSMETGLIQSYISTTRSGKSKKGVSSRKTETLKLEAITE